jgi:hypothetical protein
METAERDRRNVARLLAGGAALHLLVTAIIYASGRLHILPGAISPAGVLRGDAEGYFEKSVALGGYLSGLGARDEQVHVRLYALSSAVLTPLVGANIFGFWLVSLALYLLMLLLTYRIGRACFGARAGFAAALVGLLPSLLLHETQPLRDPLFIVLMLTLIWIAVRLVGEPVSFTRAAAYGSGGCATLLLVWMVRDNLLPVYMGFIVLALAALGVATLSVARGRLARLPNFACLLLFLGALLLIPKAFPDLVPPKMPMSSAQEAALSEFAARQVEAGRSDTLFKVNVMRRKYVVLYPEAGSNIDAARGFGDAGDMLSYLPRAVLVGLYAPFPNRWLEGGTTVGYIGHLIAGAETSFIYLLSIPGLACVWRSRRDARTWFLLTVVVLGAAALGIVVVNLGALYRMRYVFWIVLVILAAGGMARPQGLNPALGLVARLRGTLLKPSRQMPPVG